MARFHLPDGADRRPGPVRPGVLYDHRLAFRGYRSLVYLILLLIHFNTSTKVPINLMIRS